MNTLSNEKPLVTVITVTYNSALYVRDAIESVLAQDYEHIEYIIGDDCSTDNTWAIINEYEDPRIIKYRNKVNLREYPNRNKALGMAKGEYLIFIDGDDVIYAHGVGYFVKMMQQFPEAAFCVQKNYFNNIIFPIVMKPEEVFLNYYAGKRALLSSSFASNFFKLDLLKATGGLSTKYKIGDEEIRLRIAAQHSVLFVAGWVSWPRETPGQASSKVDVVTSKIENFNFIRKILSDYNYFNEEFKKLILQSINRNNSRYIVRSLTKFNVSKALKIKQQLKINWATVIKLSFVKEEIIDPLEKHNSKNPARLV